MCVPVLVRGGGGEGKKGGTVLNSDLLLRTGRLFSEPFAQPVLSVALGDQPDSEA